VVSALLSLLIWLIVFGVVFAVIYYIVAAIAVPDPLRKIILLVVGAIGLIVLLERLIPLLGHLGMILT
jgi:hypothetical protein